MASELQETLGLSALPFWPLRAEARLASWTWYSEPAIPRLQDLLGSSSWGSKA